MPLDTANGQEKRDDEERPTQLWRNRGNWNIYPTLIRIMNHRSKRDFTNSPTLVKGWGRVYYLSKVCDHCLSYKNSKRFVKDSFIRN